MIVVVGIGVGVGVVVGVIVEIVVVVVILVGILSRSLEGQLEKLGKPLMVLLEQFQGAQSFDAVGVFGGISEFAGGSGMLIDSDGGVCGVSRCGCGARMIVGLRLFRSRVSDRPVMVMKVDGKLGVSSISF